ncbi:MULTISPECIES: hypothetical protein [Haloarcula]|uniref:hypothetical protein n=1 Tax=Haloarcula TaxID=2237 RepID=UPI0023EC922A|nr:hypothetical protein [Halomicroarcula sp. XH51]
MTRIQEVLLKLETSYLGTPYYISGNALYSALARRLSEETKRHLQVSAGMFVPGEHGGFPDAHSQSGGVSFFGTGLRPVERYDDLFVFRDMAQRWLSDTRPRDAHNTHPLQEFSTTAGYAPTRSFGRPPEKRITKRTVSWYVHCYVHLDEPTGQTTFPFPACMFDGLRLGGARNYGFGLMECVETRCVDLSDLAYDRLETADAYQLELLTPYVTASEYPDADDQSIPWWWDGEGDLRTRSSTLARGDDIYPLETVDHGQVVGYAGSDPIQTAKNGLLRVGTHSQLGFGEFRLRPAEDDRVPDRQRTQAAEPTSKPHASPGGHR